MVSRWPKSPFWYRDIFGIEILYCVVQHRDRLLPGMNPCVLLGLNILYIGGQKDLETDKKIQKSQRQRRDISILTQRVTPSARSMDQWVLGGYNLSGYSRILRLRARPLSFFFLGFLVFIKENLKITKDFLSLPNEPTKSLEKTEKTPK